MVLSLIDGYCYFIDSRFLFYSGNDTKIQVFLNLFMYSNTFLLFFLFLSFLSILSLPFHHLLFLRSLYCHPLYRQKDGSLVKTTINHLRQEDKNHHCIHALFFYMHCLFHFVVLLQQTYIYTYVYIYIYINFSLCIRS